MRCPACQNHLAESDAACQQCGFTFAALDQLLGIPPAIVSEICDLTRSLASRQRRAISRLVEAFELRFPQVRGLVITCKPPPEVPLSAYAYWLFNRNQVVSAIEKGGANRLILLAIDVEGANAAAMIGYGLEPLIGEGDLAVALEEAKPGFGSGQWDRGVAAFFDRLSLRLVEVCEAVPRTYGLQGEWLDSPDQLEDRPAHAALSY